MRAIVTGAAGGLGAAIAGPLARDSADVVLLDVSADVAAMAERLARWDGGTVEEMLTIAPAWPAAINAGW